MKENQFSWILSSSRGMFAVYVHRPDCDTEAPCTETHAPHVHVVLRHLSCSGRLSCSAITTSISRTIDCWLCNLMRELLLNARCCVYNPQYRKPWWHLELCDLTLTFLLFLPVRSSFASGAFCVSSPNNWNSLPLNIRSSDSLATFQFRFKSYLFTARCTTA